MTPGTPEFDAELERFARFDEFAADAVAGGEALGLPAEGVVIRPSTGSVTDGPFTESAEILGGYYVFEADDLDRALELTAAIPVGDDGVCEVRPLVGEWTPTADAPAGQQRFLALLHGVPTEADVPHSPAWDAAVDEHGRFEASYGRHVLGGAALHPAETATTVRRRDGAPQLTDGPFAETAEVVGGFYVLAARDRDEAIRVASAIPMGDGAIELRPIVDLEA
ncbi:transcription initiation protein [Nitriliruptoraceae bacterium ZYF776]|nr:transcription initiation protein [Profundirhabdus halotolerans]